MRKNKSSSLRGYVAPANFRSPYCKPAKNRKDAQSNLKEELLILLAEYNIAIEEVNIDESDIIIKLK